jgi:hypothetical protein
MKLLVRDGQRVNSRAMVGYLQRSYNCLRPLAAGTLTACCLSFPMGCSDSGPPAPPPEARDSLPSDGDAVEVDLGTPVDDSKAALPTDATSQPDQQ